MILIFTVFVVRFWGEKYREELILNVSVFVVWFGDGNIERKRQ
jgi:hypothetical protein